MEERLARGILCRPDAASDTLPHNANLSLWVLYHVFPYKSTHVFVLGDSFFVCHVIDNHVATSSLYKTLVILKCLRSKTNKHLYSRSNRHYSKIGRSRNQEAITSSFEGQLGPSLTPELFLKLPSKCQDTLAGLCGLTGWGPTLVHQIITISLGNEVARCAMHTTGDYTNGTLFSHYPGGASVREFKDLHEVGRQIVDQHNRNGSKMPGSCCSF